MVITTWLSMGTWQSRRACFRRVELAPPWALRREGTKVKSENKGKDRDVDAGGNAAAREGGCDAFGARGAHFMGCKALESAHLSWRPTVSAEAEVEAEKRARSGLVWVMHDRSAVEVHDERARVVELPASSSTRARTARRSAWRLSSKSKTRSAMYLRYLPRRTPAKATA